MVDVYVRCILKGIISIDNVPEHWKPDVEMYLEEKRNNV